MGVRTLLGITVVLVLSAAAAGCESGLVLGEACRRDDECVNGVCVGGTCRAPILLGTEWDGAAAPPDSSTQEEAAVEAGDEAEAAVEAGDEAEAAPPDAADDTAPEAEPDAEPEAGEADAADEAASDGGADA